MPTAATLDHARPHCPGTSSNITTRTKNSGLGKGRTTTQTISQHLPCGKALRWSEAMESWECASHGFVLSGEQAAVQLNETIEMPIVEAA